MAEVHHFAYGWFNPVVAFFLAFLGSMFGLLCTARSRSAKSRGRRLRWLAIAAVSIGGAGIWLMHFMAMLGVAVPQSPLRFDPKITVGSMALAIGPVGLGLFLVGQGRRSVPRIAGGGLFTGLGVLAMHYSGMLGLRVAGTIDFDPGLVGASAVIAVVAATTALWFATSVDGWVPTVLAAAVMAVAVCGMHYTGMAAMQVRLAAEPVRVTGMSPFLLIVPITLLGAAAMIGMAISGLQAMMEEEFDGAVPGRHRGDGAPDGVPARVSPTAPPAAPPPSLSRSLSPSPPASQPPARRIVHAAMNSSANKRDIQP